MLLFKSSNVNAKTNEVLQFFELTRVKKERQLE